MWIVLPLQVPYCVHLQHPHVCRDTCIREYYMYIWIKIIEYPQLISDKADRNIKKANQFAQVWLPHLFEYDDFNENTKARICFYRYLFELNVEYVHQSASSASS